MKISPKPVTIYEKQTINLTAKITPGNAFNQSMNWKSSDDTIAKVETVNGSNMLTAKLTGKKANTKKVIISCESVHYEFAKDSFLVEVVEGPEKEYPYVDIPQDERNLGTIMSYMGWHLVTSKTSLQYKLKEDAKSTNRYSISMPEYYAMVDGRIVIATKPNIGGMLEVSIGDYVDVTFKTKDGIISTYNCILGDFKGGDAPNTWGHYDGKGVVEIIYHDYNPPDGYNENVNNPWGAGNVLKITKVGNYYSGK